MDKILQIKDLPTTAIGLIGLVVVLVSFLALTFFRRESAQIRIPIFVLMFVGAGMLIYPLLPRETVLSTSKQATTQVGGPDQCQGVEISFASGSALSDARWCGSTGAKQTTIFQAQRVKNASCEQYAKRPFGALTQNELFEQARILAKQNKFEEAFELIDACQCHNRDAQQAIRSDKLRMLCWLKNF